MSMHMRIFTDQHQYSRLGTLLTTSQVHISTLQITSPLHRWYCLGTLERVPKIDVAYISLELSQRFCLPRCDPFHVSCPPLHQKHCQCGQWKPEGWEKLRHRWAVHNILYIPDYWHSSPSKCHLSCRQWRVEDMQGTAVYLQKTIKLWWLRPLYWPTVIDT